MTPIDVERRKFLRGPRGTGFLWVHRERLGALYPAQIDGLSATLIPPDSYVLADGMRRFETFERNVAGQIGLAAAARYALVLGMDAIETRIRALASTYRAALAELPGIELTDLGLDRCGIVTFRKRGEEPAVTVARLQAARVSSSVSGGHWGGLDFHARGLRDVVRTSVHYLNTEAEIRDTCRDIAA